MITTSTKSAQLFEQACKVIPGGVNSPVRAFGAVGGSPVFIDHAQGAYVYSADDDAYIDYIGSWGPMILGHNHPAIIKAVQQAIGKGLSFGAPTELEVTLAEKIITIMPTIEKIRMVSSGTEATMSAIRLARGATGRDKIIKFEGCYHGHADSLLVKAGSGALTFGSPSSPGVPADFTKHTLIAQFNDLDSVAQLFEKHGQDIACIIIEPIAGNMNCIPPVPGFLQGLRDLCDQYQSLLIFDEVMTGFRVALGGAQALYNIKPDLTTLGKIIGGGMPVGAFGGRADIMDQLSPVGAVYQAGTLSGNPVAMAAGLANLHEISQPDFHKQLNAQTKIFTDGLLQRAQAANFSLQANQVCGMFGLFFTSEQPITRYQQVMNCDKDRFNQFFHHMLNHSIHFAPSAFEAGFISSAHGDNEFNKTWQAAEDFFNG